MIGQKMYAFMPLLCVPVLAVLIFKIKLIKVLFFVLFFFFKNRKKTNFCIVETIDDDLNYAMKDFLSTPNNKKGVDIMYAIPFLNFSILLSNRGSIYLLYTIFFNFFLVTINCGFHKYFPFFLKISTIRQNL